MAADPLTREAFAVERCAACGLGRTEPVPHDLAPYYPAAYYGGRHGVTAGFCLRRRLRWVERGTEGTAGTGVLLDIGCGDGSFLVAAKKKGWQVVGIERFPDDARRKGLEVFGDVCELIPAPGFDCITLWHSLEHMPDPFGLLKEAAGLLKPEGRLIVAVPDFGGWQARLLGRSWLHLDVPRHLWHFTKPSLSAAFQKDGLEVVGVGYQEFEYDLLGWSQSALNALFRKTPNVFFHWLTQKPTGVGRAMLALQVALGLGLTALAVPLVWLGALCRRGGTVIMIGRRGAEGTDGTGGR